MRLRENVVADKVGEVAELHHALVKAARGVKAGKAGFEELVAAIREEGAAITRLQHEFPVGRTDYRDREQADDDRLWSYGRMD